MMSHIEYKGKTRKTYIFKEDFVNTTSFFVDETRDVLHLLDMDVVVQDLAVIISTTLSSPCSCC